MSAVPASACPLPAPPAALLLAAALAAGAAAGAVAVHATFLQLDVEWSPATAAGALAGALALLAMTARPLAGVALLLALAFSNASEILVREHGMPSVLQLLVPLLLVVLMAAPRSGATALRVPLRKRADAAWAVSSAAYLAVLLASTAWAWDRDVADEAVASVLKAFVLALVVAWSLTGVRSLRIASWVLVATGAALAALSSFQVLTDRWEQSFAGFARVKEAHIAGTSLGPRATGPLADPNFYAQALLALVPLALALALGSRGRSGRVLGVLGAAVVGLGVVTTYSRGGALALFVVLTLFAWTLRRKVRTHHVVLGAVLLLAGLALTPSSFFVQRLQTLSVLLPGTDGPVERHDSSVAKRRVLMASAAEMALDRPVLGVGAGNYGTHYEDYSSRVGAQARIYHDPGERAFAHSLPLEIAAETGLLGLATFGAACVAALAAAALARRRFLQAGDEPAALLSLGLMLGLLGTLVSSLILHGDYPRYLWLGMGLAVAAWRCSARTSDASA